MSRSLAAIGRFRCSCCLLHQGAALSTSSSPRSPYLLGGDGSVPAGEVVEVPIIEGLATFSGDFVLVLHLAVGVVEAFARGAAVVRLGEWVAL